MTSQLNNFFKIKKEEYEIIGQTDKLDFEPRDFGLKPVFLHTGLWRGYYFIAGIHQDRLFIRDIYVNNESPDLPRINGIRPKDKSQEEKMYKYEKLDIPLSYSGKLLIARDYNKKYLNSFYPIPNYAYNNLLELTFEGGKLIGERDLSQRAEDFRTMIDKGEDSLDCQINFWDIK